VEGGREGEEGGERREEGEGEKRAILFHGAHGNSGMMRKERREEIGKRIGEEGRGEGKSMKKNSHVLSQVDIFSLGCIIFFVLTGTHPFGEPYEQQHNIVAGKSIPSSPSSFPSPLPPLPPLLPLHPSFLSPPPSTLPPSLPPSSLLATIYTGKISELKKIDRLGYHLTKKCLAMDPTKRYEGGRREEREKRGRSEEER
jgi:serine/threonine protein kinase